MTKTHEGRRVARPRSSAVPGSGTSVIEALKNVTPSDVYLGRQYMVLSERSKIKRRTMERRPKKTSVDVKPPPIFLDTKLRRV